VVEVRSRAEIVNVGADVVPICPDAFTFNDLPVAAWLKKNPAGIRTGGKVFCRLSSVVNVARFVDGFALL
jgi:hypothetical protein